MILDTLAALADYRNNRKFDSSATKTQCCEEIYLDLQSIQLEILTVGGSFIMNDEAAKLCPFVYGMQHRTPMSDLGTCPPIGSSSSSSEEFISSSSNSFSNSSSCSSLSYSSSSCSLSSSQSSSSSLSEAPLSWYCVQAYGGTTCEGIDWENPLQDPTEPSILGCQELTPAQAAAYPLVCTQYDVDWWMAYTVTGPYGTSDDCWAVPCFNPFPG